MITIWMHRWDEMMTRMTMMMVTMMTRMMMMMLLVVIRMKSVCRCWPDPNSLIGSSSRQSVPAQLIIFIIIIISIVIMILMMTMIRVIVGILRQQEQEVWEKKMMAKNEVLSWTVIKGEKKSKKRWEKKDVGKVQVVSYEVWWLEQLITARNRLVPTLHISQQKLLWLKKKLLFFFDH